MMKVSAVETSIDALDKVKNIPKYRSAQVVMFKTFTSI
mgnify:CR=1 FL=1